MPIVLDGEVVTDKEAQSLRRMVAHDCKEFAGQFFDMDRSEKFRASWDAIGKTVRKSPQDCFVDHAWKHFIVHVRAWYAEKLKNPGIPEKEKDKLHKAMLLEAILGADQNAESPVQLAPNTQQFIGDKHENTHIADTYGKSVH